MMSTVENLVSVLDEDPSTEMGELVIKEDPELVPRNSEESRKRPIEVVTLDDDDDVSSKKAKVIPTSDPNDNDLIKEANRLCDEFRAQIDGRTQEEESMEASITAAESSGNNDESQGQDEVSGSGEVSSEPKIGQEESPDGVGSVIEEPPKKPEENRLENEITSAQGSSHHKDEHKSSENAEISIIEDTDSPLNGKAAENPDDEISILEESFKVSTNAEKVRDETTETFIDTECTTEEDDDDIIIEKCTIRRQKSLPRSKHLSVEVDVIDLALTDDEGSEDEEGNDKEEPSTQAVASAPVGTFCQMCKETVNGSFDDFLLHLTMEHYKDKLTNSLNVPYNCLKCGYKPKSGSSEMEKITDMVLHYGTSEKIAFEFYEEDLENSERECAICKGKYGNQRLFSWHLTLRHFGKELESALPKSEPFICPECNEERSTMHKLLLHYGAEHGKSLDLYEDMMAGIPTETVKTEPSNQPPQESVKPAESPMKPSQKEASKTKPKHIPQCLLQTVNFLQMNNNVPQKEKISSVEKSLPASDETPSEPVTHCNNEVDQINPTQISDSSVNETLFAPDSTVSEAISGKDSNRLQSELDNEKEARGSLECEMKKLRDELDHTKVQLNRKKSELIKSDKALQVALANFRSKQKTRAMYDEEKKSMNELLVSVEARFIKLDEAARTKAENLAAALEKARSASSISKAKADNLQHTLNKRNAAIKEQRKNLEELEQRLAIAQKQLKAQDRKIMDEMNFEVQLSAMKEENKLKDEKISILEAKVKFDEAKASKYRTLERDMKKLQSKLNEVTAEKNAAEANISVKDVQLKGERMKITQAESKVKEIKAENETLTQEMKEVRAENKKLTDRYKGLMSQVQSLVAAANDLKALQKEEHRKIMEKATKCVNCRADINPNKKHKPNPLADSSPPEPVSLLKANRSAAQSTSKIGSVTSRPGPASSKVKMTKSTTVVAPASSTSSPMPPRNRLPPVVVIPKRTSPKVISVEADPLAIKKEPGIEIIDVCGSDPPPTSADPASICGLCKCFDPPLMSVLAFLETQNKKGHSLSGDPRKTEWIGCNQCDQWYHQPCLRGHSVSDSFSCKSVKNKCLPRKKR